MKERENENEERPAAGEVPGSQFCDQIATEKPTATSCVDSSNWMTLLVRLIITYSRKLIIEPSENLAVLCPDVGCVFQVVL